MLICLEIEAILRDINFAIGVLLMIMNRIALGGCKPDLPTIDISGQTNCHVIVAAGTDIACTRAIPICCSYPMAKPSIVSGRKSMAGGRRT